MYASKRLVKKFEQAGVAVLYSTSASYKHLEVRNKMQELHTMLNKDWYVGAVLYTIEVPQLYARTLYAVKI